LSFLITGFIREHPLIEPAEQVEELPPLLCVKWRHEFFTQFHLKAADLLELGSRTIGECKQCCAPC